MKNTAGALLITGACLLLYLKIFSFDLTYFDDHFLVEKYEQYNNKATVVQVFKSMVYTSYYRPVLSLSFLFDALRGGHRLPTYYATNLILHAMASVLLFSTLLKLGYARFLSFLAGLLVAVHPIITPAVAWIPGRNDPLLSIFILLSFIFLINYLEARNSISGKLCLGFHLLFFGLGLFSKESAAVFPIVCSAYVWLHRKENLWSRRNNIFFMGWCLVCALYAAMRLQAMMHVNNPDTIGLEALLNNYLSLFALIGKIFLPLKMNGYPEFESFSIISGIFFSLLLLRIFFLSKQIDRKNASFGLIWFFSFLIPTLLVRVHGAEFDYLEHRAYTPILGFFVFILEILKAYKIGYRKKLVVLVSMALLSIFSLRTYYYEEQFRNRSSFWTHVKGMYPQNSAAYYNLGVVAYEEGDLDESENHFLQSIHLNSGCLSAYINLSTVYKEKNNLALAEVYAVKATVLDRFDPQAYHHLGKIYILRQEWENALKALERSVELSTGENKILHSHLEYVRGKMK